MLSEESATSARRILVIDDNPAIHHDFAKIFGVGATSAAALSELEASLFGEAPPPAARQTFQIDSALQVVDMKRQQVQRAMEAGKAAAQEAREELEQRIAETKASYRAGASVARNAQVSVVIDDSSEG